MAYINDPRERMPASFGSASTMRLPPDSEAASARRQPEQQTVNELESESGDFEMRIEGDTLRVRGDLDLYEAPSFRQFAAGHIRNVEEPHLDLTEVPFLDSAGLAALLSLSRQAQDAGKVLRMKVGGSPRRVLSVTGIDRMLVLDE